MNQRAKNTRLKEKTQGKGFMTLDLVMTSQDTRSTGNKRKGGLHQNLKFCVNNTINRVKRQPTESEKTFSNESVVKY